MNYSFPCKLKVEISNEIVLLIKKQKSQKYIALRSSDTVTRTDALSFICFIIMMIHICQKNMLRLYYPFLTFMKELQAGLQSQFTHFIPSFSELSASAYPASRPDCSRYSPYYFSLFVYFLFSTKAYVTVVQIPLTKTVSYFAVCALCGIRPLGQFF